MPVKSLNSSVFKWPDHDKVIGAIRIWAEKEIPKHPELIRVGYFGSYARGDWGVGSDLDLFAVVLESATPFESRPLNWNFDLLPVPTEIIVYTEMEWQTMKAKGTRFADTIEREVVWIYESGILLI